VKERDDPVNRLLHGFQVPSAPERVRTATLAKVGAALSREPAGDRWRRVWEDRRLRWAWAATAAVLIVANLAVSGRRGRGEPVGRTVVDASSAAADRELAAVVALPRIDNRHLQTDTPNTGQRLEPPPADGSEQKESRS
jgi:hypothetical protein